MIIRLVAASIALLITFAGCGKTPQSARNLGSLDCDASGDCGTNDFTIRTQKVQGVVSQRQIIPNFQNCLGLTSGQISEASRTAYKESISSLSMEGQVKDVHAPMMMAVTNIASEMCLDLIKAEKAATGRIFFAGFTLGGATDAAQPYDMSVTANRLATACWGRPMTAAEAKIVTDDFASGVTTANKDTAAALYTCTLILSSAAAIRF